MREEIVIEPRDYLNLSDAECIFVNNINNHIFEIIKKANLEGLNGKRINKIYFQRLTENDSLRVWLDFEEKRI